MNSQYLVVPRYPYVDYFWDVEYSNLRQPALVNSGTLVYPSPPYTTAAATDVPSATVSEDPIIEISVKMITSLQDELGNLLSPLVAWLSELVCIARSGDPRQRRSATETLQIACFIMDPERCPLPPEIASPPPQDLPPVDLPRRATSMDPLPHQDYGDALDGQPLPAVSSASSGYYPPSTHSSSDVLTCWSTQVHHEGMDAAGSLPDPCTSSHELPAPTTFDYGYYGPDTGHGPDFVTGSSSHLSQPISLPNRVEHLNFLLRSSRSNSQDNGYASPQDIHEASARGKQPNPQISSAKASSLRTGPDRVCRQKKKETKKPYTAENPPPYTRFGIQNHHLSAGGYFISGAMPNSRIKNEYTRPPDFDSKQAK